MDFPKMDHFCSIFYELIQTSSKTLKEYHQILKKFGNTQKKFVDHSFDFRPPNSNEYKYTYERLEEMYGNDLFKKIDEFGICQQELADCFLIASCVHISRFPRLVKYLFIDPQLETGAACIRFQFMGKPFYVIVDTFVPTKYGGPVFSHPRTTEDGYWFCLVEKAYSKLMGGYKNISGNPGIALRWLYEFASQTVNISEIATKYHCTPVQFLESGLSKTPFVFASTDTNPKEKYENTGIVANHAYSVFGIDRLNGDTLIHLRNPHGNNKYNSDYSANSNKWRDDQKELVGFKEGGHLWIPEPIFNNYWSEFSYILYSDNGIFKKIIEFDLIPGVYDGRECMGNGPYVGTNTQWRVTFQEKSSFSLFVFTSDNMDKIEAFMDQNNGEKVNYFDTAETSIRSKMISNTVSVTKTIDVIGKPYTLHISRWEKRQKKSHLYARLECKTPFVVEEIPEPNFGKWCHTTISAHLKPGFADGRTIYCYRTLNVLTQWRIKMEKSGRIWLRLKKKVTNTDHFVFIGLSKNNPRLTWCSDVFATHKISSQSPMELYWQDIKDDQCDFLITLSRNIDNEETDFTLEMCSEIDFTVSKLEDLDDITTPHTVKIEGQLQPGPLDGHHPFSGGEGLGGLRQYIVTLQRESDVYISLVHEAEIEANVGVRPGNEEITYYYNGVGSSPLWLASGSPYTWVKHHMEAGDHTICVYRSKSDNPSFFTLELTSSSFITYRRLGNDRSDSARREAKQNEKIKYEMEHLSEYELTDENINKSIDEEDIDKLRVMFMRSRNLFTQKFSQKTILEIAAKKKKLKTVELALNCGSDWECCSPSLFSSTKEIKALFVAKAKAALNDYISAEDSERIRNLTEKYGGEIIEPKDIIKAAEFADNRALKALIKDANADVEVGGVTPMIAACKAGCVSCVDTLLRKKIKPSEKAMEAAAESKSIECMCSLINAGGIPPDLNNEVAKLALKSILFKAIRDRDINKIEKIVDIDRTLADSQEDGQTILHEAAATDSVYVLERVLEYQKDVEIQNIYGYTPLFYAISRDCEKTAAFLLDKGADLHFKTDLGTTAAEVAVDVNDVSMMALLIDRGLDYLGNIDASEGKVRKLMLEKMKPMLFEAISKKDTEGIERIMGSCGDFANVRENNLTPLDAAIRLDDQDIVKTVVRFCGSLKNGGKKYLKEAQDNNWNNSIEALLDAGADWDEKTPVSSRPSSARPKSPASARVAKTAFVRALNTRSTDEMQRILQLHPSLADVELNNGERPLHRAARMKFLPGLQLLLGFATEKDATDSNGDTAFQVAVDAKFDEGMKLLEVRLTSARSGRARVDNPFKWSGKDKNVSRRSKRIGLSDSDETDSDYEYEEAEEDYESSECIKLTVKYSDKSPRGRSNILPGSTSPSASSSQSLEDNEFYVSDSTTRCKSDEEEDSSNGDKSEEEEEIKHRRKKVKKSKKSKKSKKRDRDSPRQPSCCCLLV